MRVSEDFKWKSKRLVRGMITMLILTYLGDHFVFKKSLCPSSTCAYTGIVLILLGLVIASIGGRHLKIYGRSSEGLPRGTTDKLVTQGIYRYVRHPMFTAFILILVGLGLALNSITFTFFMAPVGIFYILWFTYNVDEKEALAKFGDSYRIYKKQVPPFLPVPGKRFRNKN